MKRCSKCKTERPLELFAIYSGKPHCWCKLCQRASSKAYYQKNPGRQVEEARRYREKNRELVNAKNRKWREAHREHLREYNRRRYERLKTQFSEWGRAHNLSRYGLTVEQYEQMYRDQNGTCAICHGVNTNGRRLHVDHDHATGKVRALLCHNCNFVIGYAKENPDILLASIGYLDIHNAKESK